MDIVLRASAMFVVVLVLLRLLGKRELAEMTPFELILLVVIGDLIQQGVTHNDFSITGASLAIGTFAFWSLAFNWISFRFPRAERFLDGEPSVLVRHGEKIDCNLRRNRITLSELHTEMRLAGIARLEDVAWAILEPNGKVSFIGAAADGDRPARGQSTTPDAG